MDQNILVAYATKYGSTAGIAEKIGQNLRELGLRAEVQAIDRIEDPSQYSAFVIGSAVYAGQWLKEAAQFLAKHETLLASRPVWLFSSGPTGEGDPITLMKGWKFPALLQPLADRIKVKDTAFFHGMLDTDKMNFGEKLIVKGIKAPLGDFRDWTVIGEWAKSVATQLKTEVIP